MIRPGYLRYEMLSNIRNRRFVFFSAAWPLILYLVVAGPQRHHQLDGVAFPLYFMTGMAAFGAMGAVVGSAARIAAERAIGWTRQMRLTPLKSGAYLWAKVISGYLLALAIIVLMCLAGLALGVRLSVTGWLTLIGLTLAGLIPLAVLGILLGNLLATDALTPAAGGIVTLLALLGGSLGFQLSTSGFVYQLTKALPSYWLVQAGKAALGGSGWPAEGWIVTAIWTTALVPLAVLAYRRGTKQG